MREVVRLFVHCVGVRTCSLMSLQSSCSLTWTRMASCRNQYVCATMRLCANVIDREISPRYRHMLDVILVFSSSATLIAVLSSSHRPILFLLAHTRAHKQELRKRLVVGADKEPSNEVWTPRARALLT